MKRFVGKDGERMKTNVVLDDKRLDLAGKMSSWSNLEGNPLDQFAIIDDTDLGTHSMTASINMIARNIGVGKKVRLVFEEVE